MSSIELATKIQEAIDLGPNYGTEAIYGNEEEDDIPADFSGSTTTLDRILELCSNLETFDSIEEVLLFVNTIMLLIPGYLVESEYLIRCAGWDQSSVVWMELAVISSLNPPWVYQAWRSEEKEDEEAQLKAWIHLRQGRFRLALEGEHFVWILTDRYGGVPLPKKFRKQ